MLKIGLDAMGGDNAPSVNIKGAIAAHGKIAKDSTIVLFGDRARIKELLKLEGEPVDKFEIIHTSQVIEMSDHPATAFAKKSDSSVVVGFNYLKDGRIDTFASAGNTGAMLVGGMTIIKQIEGVIRPSISAQIATTNGETFLLLDVGLNLDCKPEMLHQYARMGYVYARSVMGIENPRVALLNIGEEKEKGNIASKATHLLLLEDNKINFVGNIESKQIYDGHIADVVVCDGFVGNIILKMMEGFYETSKANGVDDTYIDRLSYETVGGTSVLGVQGNVVVGHGCSTPFAIENMILQAEKTAKGDLAEELQLMFNQSENE